MLGVSGINVNLFSDLKMSNKVGIRCVRTNPHILQKYKTGDFFDVMLAEIYSPLISMFRLQWLVIH